MFIRTHRRGPIRAQLATLRLPISFGGILLIAGCASFAPDGGLNDVATTIKSELGKDIVAVRNDSDEKLVRDKVAALLTGPLSSDAAVQLALINNRGLQAAFNQLFIAETIKVEAGLPPSPTFSIARLVSRPELEIERQIVINILALVTLPLRLELAENRFRQAQLTAAEQTVRLGLDTRRAYYRTIAALQVAGLLAQAQAAAHATARLAQRLGQTGALNKLDQAREQVFFAELTGQLAAARQRARSEREALTRLMGLWGNDIDFKLPGALPPLPKQVRALPQIERDALDRRFELQIAKLELVALAKSLGMTRATRFIDGLELGGRVDSIRESTGERYSRTGFEVEFTIPIFDFGETRVRQAEQIYLQAVNRLAAKAVNVRSEARDAYRTYRASYEIARHYRDEVLPLRRLIADEMLLRYNAMQIDTFVLLGEARQQLAANASAIEALRDFWLAETDLLAATIGGTASQQNEPSRSAPSTTNPAGH